jgi:catechol 2,3-dioxygenase-like lactoylglutathione lyase family enzyme
MNHLKLIVSDLERSARFYAEAFGMEVIDRNPGRVILSTPGRDDTLTLGQARPGQTLGLDHLGFFASDIGDFDEQVARVERAGGKLVRRTDIDGHDRPTAFFEDPDGFSVQI